MANNRNGKKEEKNSLGERVKLPNKESGGVARIFFRRGPKGHIQDVFGIFFFQIMAFFRLF